MGETYIAGIDTLAVGFKVDEFDLTADEWAYLGDAKANAQGSMFDSGGCPVILRGHRFSMSPKGWHGYDYVLVNDDLRVNLAARANGGGTFPEVFVTWRSHYLWRYSWEAAFAHFERWLREWALWTPKYDETTGELAPDHVVSRVDLCLDVAMPIPEIRMMRGEVVSFARKNNHHGIVYQEHMVGIKATGYTFGKGDLVCRIYDKLEEVKHSEKAWFLDMYRERGWDGESPVTRVEFQARRAHLKAQQITTITDLQFRRADLWRYFSNEWISLRDLVATDSNRRRWPVKEFWRVVRDSCDKFGKLTGVRRLTQRAPKIDKVRALLRGVLVTATALYRTTYEWTPGQKISLAEAMRSMQEETIAKWFAEPDFEEAVTKRSARLAAFA